MITYYCFNEQTETGNVVNKWTAKHVHEYYWMHWSAQMIARGLICDCTEENMLNDFMIVNWAWKEEIDE